MLAILDGIGIGQYEDGDMVRKANTPTLDWLAANSLAVAPWILFLIIFLWTPPHFWALALYLKEDYKRVNLPMLPVVKGDDATLKQIWYYSLALVALSLTLYAVGSGVLYLVAAVALGVVFIRKSFMARKYKSITHERGLFRFSIVYLLALFLALIVEGLVGP